jgi:ribosomal protein S12 methylthiotransferase accessory factor
LGLKVETKYLGGMKFGSEARGHTILCDLPQVDGGEDTAPTPAETLLAALGSCTGMNVASYCKARELDPSGISITVTGEKTKAPGRIESIVVQVLIPARFSEKDRLGIQRTADRCFIKNTLLMAPSILTEVIEGEGNPPSSEQR